MKKTSILLSVFLLGQMLLAQEISQERTLKTQNATIIGNKASTKLLQTLQKNLKSHMQSGGVMAAVKYCNINASVLTEQVQKEFGPHVSVKRVSLKQRSDANEATKQDLKMLETFQVLHDAQTLPPYLMLEKEHSFTYYKPLVIKNPACLKCHGNIQKDSELDLFLKEHYPHDKAVNYKMNDLRGLIVVDIKDPIQ